MRPIYPSAQVCKSRLEGLQPHKVPFAHDVPFCRNIQDAVKALKPSILIGVSTIFGAYALAPWTRCTFYSLAEPCCCGRCCCGPFTPAFDFNLRLPGCLFTLVLDCSCFATCTNQPRAATRFSGDVDGAGYHPGCFHALSGCCLHPVTLEVAMDSNQIG